MNLGKSYKIMGLPSTGVKPEKLFSLIGQEPFSLTYDIQSKSTSLWILDKTDKLSRNIFEISIPGLELEDYQKLPYQKNTKLTIMSFYREVNKDSETGPFEDIFNCELNKDWLSIVFIPVSNPELHKSKHYIEAALSSRNVKETQSHSAWFSSRFGSISTHRDIYNDSEEELIMKRTLESLNSALVSNNIIYKLFLAFPEESANIKNYLKNRIVELSELSIKISSSEDQINQLLKVRTFPFGAAYFSQFIKFYGVTQLNKVVKTNPTFSPIGGIQIGNLMGEGVLETKDEIKVDLSTFNLGTIVTGLPGSGKTMEAMNIVTEIIKQNNVPVFVLAPTEEWDTFSTLVGLRLIKLLGDNNRINFFRSPKIIKRERFYQDLSMVISSASAAGPYRRPMEKCLLNAFRKIYAKTDEPNPIVVYDEIEEAIIRFHGKRTNGGIKYTKHGENVKAALESLRIILDSSLYSSIEGILIEDLALNGAVFNMSNTSVATKPLLYAMILNQLYALADSFDTDGDGKLRMLICIEEAQILFKDEDAPAVVDLKQRIQDFRKKGIGLMLLCHNVIDIDSGIRRLCQMKLYFRQAPDLAYIAAKDLIFTGIEQDNIIDKLKTLNSCVAAFSTVSRKENKRIPQETIFVKTRESKISNDIKLSEILSKSYSKNLDEQANCSIKLEYSVSKSNFQTKTQKLYVYYLNDVIYELTPQKYDIEIKLFIGRYYKICLVTEKGKILGEIKIFAKKHIHLFYDDYKLIEVIGLEDSTVK